MQNDGTNEKWTMTGKMKNENIRTNKNWKMTEQTKNGK